MWRAGTASGALPPPFSTDSFEDLSQQKAGELSVRTVTRGPLGGAFPPSDKTRFDFTGPLRVENGKIADLWLTWGNVTILDQLGHLRV